MEDPESEWRIQEYSSDDEANVVKWILNKGYVIGRNIAVTGIVITSAPMVLPPLVVFSAMGVAVAVPFGLLFAIYACTNKIMRLLLPPPPPPLLLEYYKDECEPLILEYYADECERENDERVDFKLGYRQVVVGDENGDDYGPEVEGYYTDKEDNEQTEGIDQGVDVVFEFDNGSGDDHRQDGQVLMTNVDEDVDEMEMEMGMDMEDMLQGENANEEKEREWMEDINLGVKMRPSFGDSGDDQGYEEDVGGYLEEDGDSLEEERDGEEPLVEGQPDENRSKMLEINEDVTLSDITRADDIVEDDYGVGESASNVAYGDVHDVVREGSSNVASEDGMVIETERTSKVAFGDVKDVVNEGASNVASGDAKDAVIEGASNEACEDVMDFASEDASKVASGDVEITRPVIVKETDSQKLVDVESKNDKPVGEIRHVVILSQGNEENNFNSREVEELDLVAREVIGDANKDERSMESDEKVLRESMGTQEITGGNASNDGSEVVILRTMEEHLYHSNADSREIGDNEENINIKFGSLEAGNEVEENAADVNVDVLARSTFEHAPLETDNAKDACKTYKKMLSKEEKLDDEKMWEEIGAMRAIVGYKAPSQPTCIGELKALYVFTGVEPPASSDTDSDLDEVNAKLRFLMAIVGVK